MGDITNDIINGISCQQCGEYIDDELSQEGGPGFPRNCDGCVEDNSSSIHDDELGPFPE